MTTRDFTFAWEGADAAVGPWRHLDVVQVRGRESISTLFHYEITAFARDPAPEIDPDEIIRARASLRIATASDPTYRIVHGIVTEAEEIGPTAFGMLYRITLSPPLARAAHRTRSRIFLEKTIRQIVDAVLQGDPDLTRDDGATVEPDLGDAHVFRSAREIYAWRIADASRIDRIATRPYCVQYAETDLAFVSRLLEEEGIGYHYEHGDGTCLLVLSDTDAGKTRLSPFAPLGPNEVGRDVAAMKLGARLRPKKVSLLDYNWKKPALDMAVQEIDASGPKDLVAYTYPGRYPDTPDQGRPLAAAMLDRLEVEASFATGEGACRLLGAGTIFALEHPKARYDGEYLVTGVEIRCEQGGVLHTGAEYTPSMTVPFRVAFECVRRGKSGSVAESRFRPARVTPRPRIQGTQTAFVTADPSAAGAEIHVGGPSEAEIGCVRVRFHWDRDAERLAREPTSCWIRVSQMFAGVGQGGVFHPRVGVEVIVDFEDGDPDRPIVVGRVYNGQNRPPTVAPTVSTFTTMTSPADGTANELTFDDTAGSQQIKMHTPMNWNSSVGKDRSEQVANDSGSTVGTNRNEATGSHRSTMVGGNNAELVAGHEALTVGANQLVSIGGNHALTVAGNQVVAVTGDQSHGVTGNRTGNVTGSDGLQVTGPQAITVSGAQTTSFLATHGLDVSADHTITVGGQQGIHVTGPQILTSATAQTVHAPAQQIQADGVQTLLSNAFTANASATADVITALLSLVGTGLITMVGGEIVINGAPVTVQGGDVTISGSSVLVNSGGVTVTGGGHINMTAGVIKMNS